MKATKKKASRKKVTKKKTSAVKRVARQVLYANIAKGNRSFITSLAKKAGVSNSLVTDAIIQFAKKSKFSFTHTGRA